MKIDIHIHTKKIKSGDSEYREIDPKTFCETISKTNVKICAITNHNHFDKEQYDSILQQSDGIFQTWPGVELDIIENGRVKIVGNSQIAKTIENAYTVN